MSKSGTLYIVATPIGNLSDITLRALEILKKVDYVAAEDTRHTRQLLTHFGIQKPLISTHEHNEQERIARLLEHLQAGKNIALVSDAGTPLISDPGYHLVRALHDANLRVEPIPGACAAITALSVAGLPTDRFIFEGFLPAKSGLRLQRLQSLAQEPRTIIFYESVHRIHALLAAMQTAFGAERQAVVARELTKRYETIYHGTLAELLAWLENHSEQQRGEFVVLVHGANTKTANQEADTEATRVLTILLQHLPLKQAVNLAAEICQAPRNPLYQLALTLLKTLVLGNRQIEQGQVKPAMAAVKRLRSSKKAE